MAFFPSFSLPAEVRGNQHAAKGGQLWLQPAVPQGERRTKEPLAKGWQARLALPHLGHAHLKHQQDWIIWVKSGGQGKPLAKILEVSAGTEFRGTRFSYAKYADIIQRGVFTLSNPRHFVQPAVPAGSLCGLQGQPGPPGHGSVHHSEASALRLPLKRSPLPLGTS